ncbi:MAG: hypothetical protein M0P71_07350 [Melioribacteraceae bacterium]|jgi:hypothetical protein|nr:hypothetical protein [Melioribacteraceae bacterium]
MTKQNRTKLDVEKHVNETKQNLWVKKAKVINIKSTFFEAIVDYIDSEGTRELAVISEFAFEDVSELYQDRIVPNARFEIHQYRECRKNGSKIICTEIIFP